MKRRNFISTTGTAALIGATSSLSAASSVYNSFSSEAAMLEFSDKTKKVLDGFVESLNFNLKDKPANQQLSTQIAMPIRIIDKDFGRTSHTIIYKNKLGQYIKLSSEKGKETIYISNTLPRLK